MYGFSSLKTNEETILTQRLYILNRTIWSRLQVNTPLDNVNNSFNTDFISSAMVNYVTPPPKKKLLDLINTIQDISVQF